MNKLERAEFDLEMITPYFNHLKEVINQAKRIERRKEIPSEVIFEEPRDTGEFFSNGDKI